jgi:hypothetical protein
MTNDDQPEKVADAPISTGQSTQEPAEGAEEPGNEVEPLTGQSSEAPVTG